MGSRPVTGRAGHRRDGRVGPAGRAVRAGRRRARGPRRRRAQRRRTPRRQRAHPRRSGPRRRRARVPLVEALLAATAAPAALLGRTDVGTLGVGAGPRPRGLDDALHVHDVLLAVRPGRGCADGGRGLPVHRDAALLAADAVERLLTARPDAVLGLATGSSPLALYDELAARSAAGRLSFAAGSGFLLDEYVGLPADHPERYAAVVERELTARVDLAPGAVQGPDGDADDLPAACARVRAAARRRRRRRPAGPGRRHRRPRRLQRAGVVAVLAAPG